VANFDPSGATGYSAGGAEDLENAKDTTPSIPFPDPFGPYPDKPYPGVTTAAEVPPPAENDVGAAPVDDADPPTDPGMAPVALDDSFDPFAADAFWFPERPWYRKSSATVAFVAIGVAVVAMLVAAVLLVSRDSGESGGSTDATTSTPVTSAPSTTTPLSSSPPPEAPPPPPPPESPPAPAEPQGTWVPQYPQNPQQNGGDRPNVTTPQTRPPQISVRPTHRPAFPNQPGGG
jgi:hypothetical protein